MIFGEYSGDDSDAKGEIGVVVASIYEPGDVANVIYYSGTKSLALVPKNFFMLKPRDAAGLSNSQRLKRTTIFRVGENVEFELVPGSDRIVQWIRKHPEILDVFLSAEINQFVAKSTGIIPPPNVKRDRFWTKEFDWVPFDPELLREYGEVHPEVPMVVTISIDISFGEHENAATFDLDNFKPTCTYELLSIKSVSEDSDFLRFAPWKQTSELVSDHDLTSTSPEIRMKSEEENSGQPEPSQSANSLSVEISDALDGNLCEHTENSQGIQQDCSKESSDNDKEVDDPHNPGWETIDICHILERKKRNMLKSGTKPTASGGKVIRPSVDSGIVSVYDNAEMKQTAQKESETEFKSEDVFTQIFLHDVFGRNETKEQVKDLSKINNAGSASAMSEKADVKSDVQLRRTISVTQDEVIEFHTLTKECSEAFGNISKFLLKLGSRC